MKTPNAYAGPFDPPPLDYIPDGAVSWRFLTEHYRDENGAGKWRPKGWQIVGSDFICEVDLSGDIVRDSMLYSLPVQVAS